MRRCHSAPVNLALMTHRPWRTCSTIAVLDDDKDTGTVRDIVLQTCKTMSVYELVQCIVTDECPVDSAEDAQLCIFFLNALYDVWIMKLRIAFEDVLLRIISRFIVTYSVHCAIQFVNKNVMDHIHLH